MQDRVSPTDRIRGHIDELFAQDRPLPSREQLIRIGVMDKDSEPLCRA